MHLWLLRYEVLILLRNWLHLILISLDVHNWRLLLLLLLLLLNGLRAELFRLPAEYVRGCPLGNPHAHDPGMHLADVLHEKLVEVLPGSVPIIVLILHQQLLVITLEQALSLGKILAITSGLRTDGAELRLTGGLLLLELVLNLLALVPPDIYWVAAFAAAKFASIAGQCCSALEARDLAQATLQK